MKLSIIIVSYNTSDMLEKCLENLFRYSGSHPLEVFVVDNDSVDDSVRMVEEKFKEVRLIKNTINKGFAAANNQAYKKATGEYVILLNPDAYIQSGSIDNAVSFMENHPECGLAGGRLINLQGTLDPSARKFPNSINKFFTLSGLADKYPSSRIFGRGDFKFFDHNHVIEVDWVPGTFTIYRTRMLQQLGTHPAPSGDSISDIRENKSRKAGAEAPLPEKALFDERFYIYYEETDLCLQAKRHGWKIFFIPDAEVIHVGGGSARKRKDLTFDQGGSQVLKFRMRSEYLYFRKNYGLPAVLATAKVELGWHLLRYLINAPGAPRNQERKIKASHSLGILQHGIRALIDTRFGSKPPATPW